MNRSRKLKDRDAMTSIDRTRETPLQAEKLDFKAKQDAFAFHIKQQEEKRLIALMLWLQKRGYMLFK